MLRGPSSGGGEVASIHDRVVFKQEGLDQRLQYDNYQRKSLLDHFFDNEATLAAIAGGQALERGDFLNGVYETKVRRNPDRIQVQMSREGNAWGVPLKLTKGLTLEAGSSTLEIGYLIEGLPPNRPFHFAVEFNFAGMPSNAGDRYFRDVEGRQLGHLGTHLDLHDMENIGLIDQWLGIDVGFAMSRPTSIWTFPIETVSQSEGGFELVHQSVVVLPHWIITGDQNGRWSATMALTLDTTLAERRMEPRAVAAVGS